MKKRQIFVFFTRFCFLTSVTGQKVVNYVKAGTSAEKIIITSSAISPVMYLLAFLFSLGSLYVFFKHK